MRVINEGHMGLMNSLVVSSNSAEIKSSIVREQNTGG